MGVTRDVASFIIDTLPEQIPDRIFHEGKRCLINYLAVALYASQDSSLDILLDVFREEEGGQHATIVGNGFRTTLQNAALANGYLGHLEDYDDTHFPTIIHPSSPTLPAALAVAEKSRTSGLNTLTTSILGMEICCRIGMSVHPNHYDKGWHITGTCGVFGAAGAAGRILGLNTSQMIHALGIAGAQASGVREVFGSMTKPFHAGRAAQSGLLAGLLARRGFTSATTILEGRRGFAAVLSDRFDLSRITNHLGEKWELQNNGLKPYACGVVNHPLIDAMVNLRNTEGVSPETVESVSARVHPLVMELVDRQHPILGLQGKFSFQHSMAVALVDGLASPVQYTDSRVNDTVIVGLRDKIKATVDTSQEEGSAIVTLTQKDGRSYTETISHARGTPENPMTDEELSGKFRLLAGEVVPKEKVERALETLWSLEEVDDISDLFPLLQGVERNIK